MLKQKEATISNLNGRISELEKQLDKFEKVIEYKTVSLEKLEKKYRQTMDDKEKLRQRIMSMKMKNVSSMIQKLCKNCSQEYLESENFNWSCRTHRVN